MGLQKGLDERRALARMRVNHHNPNRPRALRVIPRFAGTRKWRDRGCASRLQQPLSEP